MAYSTAEARGDLLDALATATDELALALANAGAAYELLDEASGERLEEALFRPVQHAYGRARRAHSGFAGRVGLPGRDFAQPNPGVPSTGVRGLLERSADAILTADSELAELQDSMLPVEVGDPELRADLADVRERLAPLEAATATFMRSYGR
jgi:hypothetical protein